MIIITWASYRVAYIVKYLKLFIVHLHLTEAAEAHHTHCMKVVTAKHKHYTSDERNISNNTSCMYHTQQIFQAGEALWLERKMVIWRKSFVVTCLYIHISDRQGHRL